MECLWVFHLRSVAESRKLDEVGMRDALGGFFAQYRIMTDLRFDIAPDVPLHEPSHIKMEF